MRTWSQLQEILQEIMGPNNKVYFQPPENLKLSYPCIKYERSNALVSHADNLPYRKTKRYMVTLMCKTSDNDKYLDKLLDLPMCTFDREYKMDGIVHSVFNIYF